MQRGEKLNVRTVDLARKGQPFFDRKIRIGVASITRRQFLECGGQYAQLHRAWLEWP